MRDLMLSAIFCRDSSSQNIFDKDPIPPRRIVDKHMGHSPDKFSVLDNW